MYEECDSFIEVHGHYVNAGGEFIFSDGAIVEQGMHGRLLLPPEDEFEKATLIARYWLLVSQDAEQHFLNFKNYLAGNGRREPAWARLYTEEDQLAHLTMLQQQAKRARAKYYAAKRKVKENTPFWIEEQDHQEIDESKRNHEFHSRVDAIQL